MSPPNNVFTRRFAELAEEAKSVSETERLVDHGGMGSNRYLDTQAFAEWKIKVRNLLANACGKDSEHYAAFIADAESSASTPSVFKRLRGCFNAAKEDYEGGYILTGRQLVQAEVLSSELDQARELLTKGYKVAAAVIAGVVLETYLQECCRRHDIKPAKSEAMNTELAKRGVYNVLRQKQITALSDLRNKAAHGKNDEFSDADVENMVNEVERFVAD